MLLAVWLPAYSTVFSFTKIIETNTGALDRPAFDGENVAFRYTDVGGVHGIFNYNLNSASLDVVADRSTPMPGGAGNFSSFGHRSPSLNSGNQAFFGSNQYGAGIYLNSSGLSVIADTATAIPSGVGSFIGFDVNPSVHDGNVAFLGKGMSNQEGIYSSQGGLHKIADTNTAIPGGLGNYSQFTDPTLDNGHVAFSARGAFNQRGVYTNIAGLNVVADTATPIPGGTTNFASFSDSGPALDNGNVAFVGDATRTGSKRGVYTDIGGLHKIADTGTPIPEGIGTFVYFESEVSLSGNVVAFVGVGVNKFVGLYLDVDGILEKVLDNSSLFDGKSISYFGLSKWGLHQESLAFSVRFVDQSEAIYVANPAAASVPESTTLALIGLGLAGIGCKRHRRKKAA